MEKEINILDFVTPEEKELYNKLPYNPTNDEAKRLFSQEIFKRSFKSFVYLLGYRDLGEFHSHQLDRISIVRHLDENKTRRLWLWARGHFKTSLIIESHTLWLIVNNPNIRFLIVSNTLEIAKSIIKNIKSHLISNNDFRYFFKEFCPKESIDGKIEFGTTENFTIPNRIKVLKEPTVMCAGIGTNLTGLHFDYIKIDDLVTKDSVSNDTQIQASKDYYASLRQLFDNPTLPKEDVVGTTYHYNDLYAGIQKIAEFTKSIIPAKDENGKIAFPERFSEQGLLDILNDPSVGPYSYASQYLLNPINPADAKFRSEWWKEYESLSSDLAEYILVDPASTQKKKSDFTVIEHWGKDWQGNDYLIEGIRDKLTVFQRIDKIVEFAKRCKRLVEVKYEVLGGRHGDLESLKQRFLLERLSIEPKETKSTTSSKVDRIEQRLVGRFHAGVIYFPKSYIFRSEYDGKTYDFVQEYRLEYLQFPFSEHDDCLDCHAQMFEDPLNLTLGRKPKNEVEHKWGTADDWQKEYDFYEKEKGLFTYDSQQALERLRFRNIQRVTKH